MVGLFVLAGGVQQLNLNSLGTLIITLVACLAANLYIVGLNQLRDIDIDRVNKPYLPLASGKFSLLQGKWIVILAALSSIALAFTQTPVLLVTVVASMAIGTAYSLPPLFLKGRPIWAALSIAFVRGFVANVGLFLHFNQKLQPGSTVDWPLLLGLAFFFFGFGLVIALYKDIPDLSGDREFGIRTFTVRLGPKRVFNSGRLILSLFYLVPIIASLAMLPQTDGFFLLISHLIIVALFLSVSRSVDLNDTSAITRFYMFLWSLFYAEYILLSLNTIFQTGVQA